MVHLIQVRRPDLELIYKKKKKKKEKENLPSSGFWCFTVKKKSKKRDKYLDLARDLGKLWNMKVPVIPIDVGAFGTIPKGLERGLQELEIRGRIETVQTTALLRSAWILRGDLKIFAAIQTPVTDNQLTLSWKKSASIQRLEDYIEMQGGRPITATRNNSENATINRNRKQKWDEKQHCNAMQNASP